MVLAVDLAFVNLISSSTNLNQALRQGGVYEAIAPSVSDIFINGIKSNNISNEQLIGAIRQAITPAVIETSFQPAVVGLSGWLKKGDFSNPPDLSIDMTPIKAVLNEQILKSLPAEQVDIVQFELTKSVPDSLSLASLSSSKNPADVKVDNSSMFLTEFSKIYQSANGLILPLIAGSILGLVLIFMVNLRRGRKKLLSPSWSFLLASIFAVVLVFATPAVVASIAPSNAEKSANNMVTQVMANFAIGVVSSLWLYIVVYGVIAIAGFVASFVLIHPKKDK